MSLKNRFYGMFCLVEILGLAISCTPEIVYYNMEPSINGTLNGFVRSYNLDAGSSSFTLQLIEGDVTDQDIPKDYVFPEAQVFVTERDGEYRFDNLTRKLYTLIVSRRCHLRSISLVRIKREFTYNALTLRQDSLCTQNNQIEVLSEDAETISEVKLSRGGTQTVCFYLHNNMEWPVWYDINYIPSGNPVMAFFVNGEVIHIGTSWIKQIAPQTGVLEANEIALVEVVIDPNVYLLNEHADCRLLIGREKEVRLSF